MVNEQLVKTETTESEPNPHLVIIYDKSDISILCYSKKV